MEYNIQFIENGHRIIIDTVDNIELVVNLIVSYGQGNIQNLIIKYNDTLLDTNRLKNILK